MNPKISIIIPVYGVERYLDRCVRSIVDQTYENLEIILVDDGSPDNCPKLCDEWAMRDSRIKTVHCPNGGQSRARNIGLSIANGDFVTFVDSDDWIAVDTYECCINLMNCANANAVEFGYITTKEFKSSPNTSEEVIDTYFGKEVLKYYLESSFISGSYSVCRCLFPRTAVRNVRFREGKINEDMDFKYKALKNVGSLVVTNKIYYYYFQHGETTSSGGLKARDFDLYEAANEMYNLAKDEDANLRRLAYLKVARTPFSLLSKIVYFGIADDNLDKEKVVKSLMIEHRQNLRILLHSPMSMSRKVLAVCFVVNFKFTNLMVSLVKRVYRPI